MRTRIAILSDIHGNFEALKAVLENIESRGIETIYCLGDIVGKGIHAKECVHLVKDTCSLVIKGNWDDNVSRNWTEEELKKENPLFRKRILWNQSLLGEEEKKYLASLPLSHEFYLSGSLVRIFHASLDALVRCINVIDSMKNKEVLFCPSSATLSNQVCDIVIFGHTHSPFLDSHIKNKTLINPGSVGNALSLSIPSIEHSKNIETTRASYLILEGNLNCQEYQDDIAFQFVKVPYSISKELEDNQDNLEKDSYALELTDAYYRDYKSTKEYYKSIGIDIEIF